MLPEAAWRIFVNRSDQYLAASAKGRWYAKKEPITRTLFTRAVSGVPSLGRYAVSPQGTSKWVCLDVDDFTDAEQLSGISRQLDPRTSLFEYSRRGAHLWLMFQPVPWQQAHLRGQELLHGTGINAELYPTKGG